MHGSTPGPGECVYAPRVMTPCAGDLATPADADEQGSFGDEVEEDLVVESNVSSVQSPAFNTASQSEHHNEVTVHRGKVDGTRQTPVLVHRDSEESSEEEDSSYTQVEGLIQSH